MNLVMGLYDKRDPDQMKTIRQRATEIIELRVDNGTFRTKNEYA
jgi:hypothetical protein